MSGTKRGLQIVFIEENIYCLTSAS